METRAHYVPVQNSANVDVPNSTGNGEHFRAETLGKRSITAFETS